MTLLILQTRKRAQRGQGPCPRPHSASTSSFREDAWTLAVASEAHLALRSPGSPAAPTPSPWPGRQFSVQSARNHPPGARLKLRPRRAFSSRLGGGSYRMWQDERETGRKLGGEKGVESEGLGDREGGANPERRGVREEKADGPEMGGEGRGG